MSELAISILLSANSVWHAMAAYYFTRRGRGLHRVCTVEKTPSVITLDVLRALGLINLGYVLLALLALFFHRKIYSTKNHKEKKIYHQSRRMALVTLACANLSQFAFDLSIYNKKEWIFATPLQIIFAGDFFIGILDLLTSLKK
jgi:hypothetical protein